LTVTLAISASGQPADALPEPQLPAIAGARVYPDRTRDSTNDSGQWLHGKRTRTFAIVPERNGTLTIPAITLDWWNVAQNRPEQAKTPAHTLEVGGVVAASSAPAAPPAASGAPATAAPENAGTPTPQGSRWRDIALASVALWVLLAVAAFAWWLSLRRRRATAPAAGEATAAGHAPKPSPAAGSTRARGRAAKPDARPDPKALQREALDAARAGEAAACEHRLLAWARAAGHAVAGVGALRDALADPAQRAALDALQRARWQGADAADACNQVSRAFASGFAWRGSGEADGRNDALPPLYPL
jgi:hypothetical protein